MIKVYTYSEKPINIHKLSSLFESAFTQKFDIDYWKWRFLSNPNSNIKYIIYAEDNNEIVAYYAVSPMLLADNKKIALSNMTMTHPNYQGKGLFTKLADILFIQLKKDNFIGVYGFANSNSHYGFRKRLNWKDIATLNIFKLEKGQLRSFLIKNEVTFSYKYSEISSFSFEQNESFKRTENNKIHTLINIDNFDWRFKNIPTINYRVIELVKNRKTIAFLVYKKFQLEIDIMELWVTDDYLTSKDLVITHLVKNLVKKYNSNINIWSNLFTDEHLILEKIGFKETSFNTYFGFIPFTEDPCYTELKNWHYRFIDSDIY